MPGDIEVIKVSAYEGSHDVVHGMFINGGVYIGNNEPTFNGIKALNFLRDNLKGCDG